MVAFRQRPFDGYKDKALKDGVDEYFENASIP